MGNVNICQTCKNQFIVDSDDLVFYKRLGIPGPIQCPYCRWKHLLGFWVFGRFRKTNSALSGKTIITTFPESVQFPLYDRTEFVSDAWDPLSYGQDFDSSRSFFDQFAELQRKVPHPHQSGTKNANCDWSDDVWNSRECYLCRSLLDCEFLSYGYRTFGCKNSIDLTYCFNTEFSYDCLNCFKCYKMQYSFNAHDCLESSFLFDCRNCTNCFMCWNLRNKQYHIFNKPYTKETYSEKLKEFDTRSWTGIQKLKQEFERVVSEKAVHRANFNVQTTNVSGNFITQSKNCSNCYFVDKSENVRNAFRGIEYKEVIDCVGSIAEKAALSVVDGYVYDTIATSHSSNCRYSAYLDYCEECENCFGCVGLRKKKFCILNKQYSEPEYKALVEKIKDAMNRQDEWGRFLPASMAYSGYNFSLAHVYFPETQEVVEALGWRWEKSGLAQYDEAISGDKLPDKIDDVKNEIIRERVICPETKLSYNITEQELIFYRDRGIPLPRRHFDWRTLTRFRPLSLMIYPQQGVCYFCKNEMMHYYSPALGYKKISCIECYQKEIA